MLILLSASSCEKENMTFVTLEKETYHSSIIDDDYLLYTFLPNDYSEDIDYPVVVFLDGDWYSDFFTDELNKLIKAKKIPPCIVVGVGYPLDGGYREVCSYCTEDQDEIIVNRLRDYTYPQIERYTVPTGGGAEFSKFLNQELLSEIESRYSTDSTQYFLMGHSLGGLSTFYNVFQPESRFNGFGALSASLWWNGGYTFQLEEEYSENNTDLPKKVYAAYGTAESGSLAAHNVELFKRLKSRAYPSLQLKTEVFKGASHRQVSWKGFTNGMIHLLNQ